MKTRGAIACVALFAALGSGCATTDDPVDPYQSANRKVWTFNDGMDQYALRPLAIGWKVLWPRTVKTHFQQFLDHLMFPRTFVNDLLQAEVKQSGVELGRFLVNSTIGIVGFFDPATGFGLEGRPEDFGQTLGVWGLDQGSYIMLPVWGPADTRDLWAMPLDMALTPPFHTILDRLNLRAINDGDIQELRENALDWYSFVRNAYRQRRDLRTRNGVVDETEETEDDFYELDDDDE